MSSYEEKALQLDRELAEAMGWTNIRYEPSEVVRNQMEFHGVCPKKVGYLKDIPRWTMDDREAFRLAVEYDIHIKTWKEFVCATYWEDAVEKDIASVEEDFPDKLSAVRFAICQAVLQKLKGNV